MPEFVLDYGSSKGAAAFETLDAFTRGYVEGIFFTSTGSGDDGDLLDANFGELAAKTLKSIIEDCKDFQESFAALLEKAYSQDYDAHRAGVDFWFTRNGHGAGFWDRGLDVGEELSEMARPYGAVDLYRGDNGKLYLS